MGPNKGVAPLGSKNEVFLGTLLGSRDELFLGLVA